MDVRGPADIRDINNNLSQVRRELLRFESAETSSKSTPRFTSHANAPQVVQLIEQLKVLPEVRVELVAQTVAKLREGHYSTRNSAEKTAEAILSTLSKE